MPEIQKSMERMNQASPWRRLKDRIAKKIKHQVIHSEHGGATSVRITVKSPDAKKKPLGKKITTPSSGRPLEQVLVGSWNALIQIPEKQGKGIVNIYDKLRFPKLTAEEQKMQDHVHVFLKKYQKEIGWGVTGVEAAVLTIGVVKGFQYLQNRRAESLSRPSMSKREVGSKHAMKSSRPVQDALEIVSPLKQQKLRDLLLQKITHEPVLQPKMLDDRDQSFLKDFYFSSDLREKIHAGVLEEFAGVLDQRKGALQNVRWDGERRAAIDNMMLIAASKFAAGQLQHSPDFRFDLIQMRKDKDVFVDVIDYITVWRHMMEKSGLYDARGMNGKNIEDLLK